MVVEMECEHKTCINVGKGDECIGGVQKAAPADSNGPSSNGLLLLLLLI